MLCRHCDRKMTALTTVVPFDYLPEDERKPTTPQLVRRGMPAHRACYPCNNIVPVDTT